MRSSTGPSLRDVLAQYGIGEFKASAFSGNTTSVWRVDTAQAAYVLRLRPPGALAQVRARHSLLEFLAEHASLAPTPVRALDGACAVSANDHLFELLTWMEGTVAVTGWDFPWDDRALLESAGSLHGVLNRHLRTYRPPRDAVWYKDTLLPDARVAQTQLRSRSAPEVETILAHLELVYLYAARVPSALPVHVVHNDFAWHNLVFSGSRAIGIIDFDSARDSSELSDLAYAIYTLAPVNATIAGRTLAPDHVATRIRWYLDAYARGLADEIAVSAESILDATAHRVAVSAATLIGGYLSGEERATRLITHAVGYAQWLGWYDSTRADLIGALQLRL